MFESLNAGAPAEPVAEPVAPPAPEPTAPEAAPAAPSPVALDDNALLEFKVNGELIRKPWSEIRQTQAMLPSAFTQKTQELATQRRQAEELYAQLQAAHQEHQRREQLFNESLSDPNRLGALYLAALSKAQGQGAGQPNALPQAAPFDPQQLLQQARFEAQQAAQSQWQQLQAQQAQSTLAQDFESFGQSLIKGTPLEKVPGFTEGLWAEVYKAGPSTPAQAKEYAQMLVQTATSAFAGQQQQAAAQAAVVAAKAKASVEPSTGQPVLPQSRKYSGTDDPHLREDMLAYLQQKLAGD